MRYVGLLVINKNNNMIIITIKKYTGNQLGWSAF